MDAEKIVDAVLDLLFSGKADSCRQAAEMLGVGYSTVLAAFKRFGTSCRSASSIARASRRIEAIRGILREIIGNRVVDAGTLAQALASRGIRLDLARLREYDPDLKAFCAFKCYFYYNEDALIEYLQIDPKLLRWLGGWGYVKMWIKERTQTKNIF